MTGSSSTWYAINAFVRISRSSAARAEESEDGNELLRVPHERVRPLALQHLVAVDAAPRHRDRMDTGGLRGADVERRVADIGRLRRRRAQAVDGGEDRIGRRLLPLRVVRSDHDLEVLLELRQPAEGEIDGGAALGGDDPEPPTLVTQP